MVLEKGLRTYKNYKNLLAGICSSKRRINVDTLEKVILLAIEIAREGREGRKIGTMFVVSDSDEVLKCSKCLILDPFLGHPDSQKHIDNHNMRETIKELAQGGAKAVEANNATIEAAMREEEQKPHTVQLQVEGTKQ